MKFLKRLRNQTQTGTTAAPVAATRKSAVIGTRHSTVPDGFVVVRRDALAAYVGEYHHHGRYHKCTADGQDWPCATYTEIRRALDE